MAGTSHLKKHNNNNISKLANLYISLSILPNIICCLWLQQPQQVVESNNSKCSSNERPMKENSTNNCNNSRSCTGLADRISINYNYNITARKKKQQRTKERPLALSTAAIIIIMSLSILLIQMPRIVQSKSVYEETAETVEDRETVANTSAASDTKLLSLVPEVQPREHISSWTEEMLKSLDILRHMQHTQQHQRERRKRLRKRHTSDLIISKYLHEIGPNLEWKNPCNVAHINVQAEVRHVTKHQAYQYLRKFERDVGMEYEFISATANTININDMADWSKHDELFNFLPKLNVNGSIALSRWYRNMQVYVASFGYLARVQYKFDQKKRMFVGSTSEELNKLLASARFILCELETTINGSSLNNNLKKLRTISRKAMNKRLNFVTKHQLLRDGGVVAANSVDLKFAKFSYLQYLRQMEKILKYKLQNQSRKFDAMDNSQASSSYNSNTIVVGDDSRGLDFSSIFKSDSSLSLGESVEILLKTTKKPHTQRRRTHKRNNFISGET